MTCLNEQNEIYRFSLELLVINKYLEIVSCYIIIAGERLQRFLNDHVLGSLLHEQNTV